MALTLHFRQRRREDYLRVRALSKLANSETHGALEHFVYC